MADSDYKETITKLLKRQRRPLPTLKIARKTDMAWSTTKKHLEEMRQSGLVSSRLKGKKIYWTPILVHEHLRRTEKGRITRVRTHRRRKSRTKPYWSNY